MTVFFVVLVSIMVVVANQNQQPIPCDQETSTLYLSDVLEYMTADQASALMADLRARKVAQ